MRIGSRGIPDLWGAKQGRVLINNAHPAPVCRCRTASEIRRWRGKQRPRKANSPATTLSASAEVWGWETRCTLITMG
jgi:hypothetical protein